jgi:hypothetical protein
MARDHAAAALSPKPARAQYGAGIAKKNDYERLPETPELGTARKPWLVNCSEADPANCSHHRQ